MKLEFLGDISAGGKFKGVVSENLIRLYDFSKADLIALVRVIKEKIIDEKSELELEKESFIRPINCSLKLILSPENLGILTLKEDQFICNMNLRSYDLMVSQIDALIKVNPSGYMWLDNLVEPGDIDFLLSWDGSW